MTQEAKEKFELDPVLKMRIEMLTYFPPDILTTEQEVEIRMKLLKADLLKATQEKLVAKYDRFKLCLIYVIGFCVPYFLLWETFK